MADIRFSTPNTEEDFYRQAMEPDVADLISYYTQPEEPQMTSVVPPDIVYDAEVGDYISREKAAARNAIRAKRANLAMDRAVYGMSPGYSSITMRDNTGPFAYMGDMPPTVRPSDAYGEPVAPKTLAQRAYDAGAVAAENAAYGALGAITGGLIGEGTARNIKEFVSFARSPAIKKDIMPFVRADGGVDYTRGSRADTIADLTDQLNRDSQIHADALAEAKSDPSVRNAYLRKSAADANFETFYETDGDLDPNEPFISENERDHRLSAKKHNERLKQEYDLAVAEEKRALKDAFRRASGGYSYDVSSDRIDFLQDTIYDLQNDPVRALGYDRERGAPLTDSVAYTGREAMGERFTVTPEGEVVYQPRVHPRLYPNEDFSRIPSGKRAQFIPEQPPGVFTTDNPDLMPDFIRDRTDIVSYDAAGKMGNLRSYKQLDEAPAAGQRYMQYKVLPVDAPQSAYAPVRGMDYQSEARQKSMYDYFGKYPNPPEGVTAADFEFERPKLDKSGMIRGAAAGMAGEAAYAALQESTSVPAAYVKEQVAKLQGGNYIPDLAEVPEIEKPAVYTEMLTLLNYGLPAGYFGSERHKREEEMSQNFGAPLTTEVKLARDMMKLTAKMQDQKIVKAADPSLVDQFKDFGLTLVESEAAAALAALL